MFKFNNLKISTKMFLVLFLPTIALIVISVLSIFSIKSVSNNLVNKLYLQSSQSVAYILNADRDFYQALVAQMNMQQTSDANELKTQGAAYSENAKQTIDGILNAKKIIDANKVSVKYTTH